MPNFDEFERLVRRAMVARESDMSGFAASFEAIPPANRPRQFKKISESEFTAWLIRSRNCLRALYGEEVTFSTSDRNMVGADLQVLESGVQIELKTGAVTDANLGVGTIAWAMGDKSGNKELNAIMDGPEMAKRRQLAQNGRSDKIRASQEATMIALDAYFRARISQGAYAPAKLAHLVRCIARGITKQKEMKKLMHKTKMIGMLPTSSMSIGQTDGKRLHVRFLLVSALSLRVFSEARTTVAIRSGARRSSLRAVYQSSRPKYTPTTKIPTAKGAIGSRRAIG